MSKQKNYFGRVAALLLALGLCCAPAAAAESDTAIFSDVPADAWYADAAAYVSENGLMGGTGAATFSPNAVMTRGMLVTVLCRAAGSPALAEGDLEAPFQDVPLESWYAQSIYWARAEELVSGYENNRFGPDDPVTREQLAVILWRFAGCPEGEAGEDFADEGTISPWASAAVDWARDQGLVSGKSGNRFDPYGQATRAEAAVILAQYHRQSAAQPPEPDPEEPDVDDPDPEEPEGALEGLPPNRYDSASFVVEDGFLMYQGGTPSYVGVDVSSHQGLIDWERVAQAGVEFAVIRVGYRGYTMGGIYQDTAWEHNITGALEAGLDVGIYFYSQATSVEEAREEALQTLEWIEGYDITYPVVFDWERVSGPYSRTSTTTGDTVTACARAFCELIEEAGYTAMTYGSPSKVGRDFDLSLLAEYPFWLAHYTAGWQPTSFRYHFVMWQYTSSGYIDGISTRVDLNLCLADWDFAREDGGGAEELLRAE